MPNSPFIGPILETDIQTPHYFNGRVLTAADLKAGQDATNTRQVWFGKSSGSGIIDGLQVTSIESDTQLHIAPGFGMNRQGQVIHFKDEISLPPLPPPPFAKSGSTANAGQFTSVKPQSIQPGSDPSAGVYLLTIIPTSKGYKGTATTQLQAGNTAVSSSHNLPGTTNQWEVERIRTKIIRLASDDLSELYNTNDLRGIQVNDKNRRNLVAHWCYGTLNLQNLGNDPFSFQQQYGDVDPLSSLADLGEDDIPLATFHWNGTNLTFVDMWSVRRRIIPPDALTGSWQAMISNKRIAMNQARFLQFQDHLADIIQQSKQPGPHSPPLGEATLTDYFTFLPPVGFLQVTVSSVLTRLSQGTGDTGKSGQTDQGETSSWWNTFVSGVENIAKAIDPLHWLRYLQAGVSNHDAQLQSMGAQIAALTEQVTALQGRDLAGKLQKQQGESGTPSEGAGTTDTSPGESTLIRKWKPGTPLESETSQQSRLASPDRVFHDQVLTWLKGKSPNVDIGSFNLVQSFTGIPTHMKLIGNDSFTSLLQQSWHQDAIDLRPDVPDTGQNQDQARALASFSPKATNLYLVAENLSHPTTPVYTILHKTVQPTVFLDTAGGYQ